MQERHLAGPCHNGGTIGAHPRRVPRVDVVPGSLGHWVLDCYLPGHTIEAEIIT